MGQGLEFGERTGSVDFYDFDEAVAHALGALPDSTKNEWYLPLKGIYAVIDGRQTPIERALVAYKRPEPTQISAALPMISIIRDSVTPAEERILSPVISYRLPCEGAQQVSAGGCTGWTSYEQKDKEQPYDFFYTIECWSRFRTVSQILLQIMMKRFPILGQTLVVVDGLNNPRTYAAYQQTVNDLTDVSSLVERVPGYSLAIRVEGELTLDREPICIPAFTGTRTASPLPGAGGPGYQLVPGPGGYGLVPADNNGIPLIPGGVQNPNPGNGGIYGTGRPIIRTGIYGSSQ
jgi:hypothetical protein